MKHVSEWFESYTCGCVSDIVTDKTDLPGYCGTHGTDRASLFHRSYGIESSFTPYDATRDTGKVR